MKTVEQRIDDAALALFRQIEADEQDPAQPSICQADLGPMVESYLVLNAKKVPLCTLDKRVRNEWDIYKKGLNWESLNPGAFRHEHRSVENGSVLIAYSTGEMPDGQKYYVAAKLRLEVIQSQWLDEEVGKLGPSRRVAIMDEHGNLVYGAPVGGSGHEDRFLYDDTFGKTLYRWHIRIAPKDVEALQAKADRKKVFAPLMIILSTVIIAVGLGIVWLAVLSERRTSRLKSDFIANVSHELKTPLSLIRMFGEMVATGKHKGEGAAREYGGIITRESERLSHLIDNVLDFARLERGKASYDFSEGDVADVLERALDVCRYRRHRLQYSAARQTPFLLTPQQRAEQRPTTSGITARPHHYPPRLRHGAVEIDAINDRHTAIRFAFTEPVGASPFRHRARALCPLRD